MSPILGIWASSRPAIAPDTGAMFPLQVVTVGPAGASSVEFTNIPSTYAHLQIRAMSFNNDTDASGLGNVRCSGWFNGDENTANYKNHILNGNGSSATSLVESDAKWVHSSVRNSMIGPGVSVTDILDYANTNKNKTTRAIWGWDNNSTAGTIRIVSGLWMNTAAITSIKIVPESGAFKQYSQFALYAVKGA